MSIRRLPCSARRRSRRIISSAEPSLRSSAITAQLSATAELPLIPRPLRLPLLLESREQIRPILEQAGGVFDRVEVHRPEDDAAVLLFLDGEAGAGAPPQAGAHRLRDDDLALGG